MGNNLLSFGGEHLTPAQSLPVYTTTTEEAALMDATQWLRCARITKIRGALSIREGVTWPCATSRFILQGRLQLHGHRTRW